MHVQGFAKINRQWSALTKVAIEQIHVIQVMSALESITAVVQRDIAAVSSMGIFESSCLNLDSELHDFKTGEKVLVTAIFTRTTMEYRCDDVS